MIPKEYLDKFIKLDQNLDYGTVTLILHKKNGRKRYEVGFLESFVPPDELSMKEGKKE